MFASIERHDWNFWMWWLFATAIASVVALLAIVLILGLLDLPFLESDAAVKPTIADQVLASLIFALAGLIFGLGQFLALRMLVPQGRWWIPATAAGWLMGYITSLVVGLVAADYLNQAIALFLPWLIIGLWCGLLQWLVLRQHYPGPGTWVIVTGLATLVGAIGWIVGSICGGTFSWAITGAITGYILLRFEARKFENEE